MVDSSSSEESDIDSVNVSVVGKKRKAAEQVEVMSQISTVSRRTTRANNNKK